MPDERDIASFDTRAGGYEDGWLGAFHRQVAERTAAIVQSQQPRPQRILDAGCGSGYLLRLLASGSPGATGLVGLDPSPSMVEIARSKAGDPRVEVQIGFAESLPFGDDAFDLVVSTTSFDHWADQRTGIGECARVLSTGGRLVLVDLVSPLLVPTMVGSRRTKARTKSRVETLLSGAGFASFGWHRVHTLIRAVVATVG